MVFFVANMPTGSLLPTHRLTLVACRHSGPTIVACVVCLCCCACSFMIGPTLGIILGAAPGAVAALGIMAASLLLILFGLPESYKPPKQSAMTRGALQVNSLNTFYRACFSPARMLCIAFVALDDIVPPGLMRTLEACMVCGRLACHML